MNMILKRFKLLLLAPVFLITLGLAPTLVFALVNCSDPASPADAIQCGTDNAAGVPQATNAGQKIDTTIQNVINLLSVAVGIAAVIMLIVGGFRYVTSAGSQETVKAAKNTILYALIGLVIVALAQLIVNFVLNKTTQPPSPPTSLIDSRGA